MRQVNERLSCGTPTRGETTSTVVSPETSLI